MFIKKGSYNFGCVSDHANKQKQQQHDRFNQTLKPLFAQYSFCYSQCIIVFL